MTQTRVLHKFDIWLHLLNAYNFNYFYRNAIPFLHRFAFFCCATIINFIVPLLIFLAIWFIFDSRDNFKKSLAVIPVQASIVQMQLTFMALFYRKCIINGILDRVRRVVDYRKSFSASHSKQAQIVFEHAESRYVLLVKLLTKISIFTILLILLTSAMFPISHAIFDYPPPELWTLPVEIQ